MRLQTKLMLLICSLLIIVIVALTGTFHHLWTTSLKNKIGTEAIHLAKTIASLHDIRQAFDSDNPTAIVLPIVERIRMETGAQFIVVGDRQGIRVAHPLADRIGKPMVGGDNEAVFQGKSIISDAWGSMGRSLRGKVPIYDMDHKLVGVVSVGFLMEEISQEAVAYQTYMVILALLAIFLGGLGSIYITRNVKRSIHGLEPAAIGRLYREKETLIESIKEGIIAVNETGQITTINQAAFELMGLRERQLIGAHIYELFPQTCLMQVIQSGHAQYNVDMKIADKVLVANRVPIVDEHNQVIGAVSSFRSKSDLYALTEQLSQLRNYADGLRAQTHEYSNKLHLIAGLIQLESYQEALDVISKESDIHESFTQFMMRELPDPIIGGLLIGKFNRAHEMGVNLVMDPASCFKDVPAQIDRFKLVTIIGNLLDNALEAVLQNECEDKLVHVMITDWGQEVMIEIEDNGVGIPNDVGEHIYRLGFTTKAGEHRGFGLILVKQAVEELRGILMYHAREDAQGTVFTVIIPKMNDTG
ncbi:ATP-binding protein [Paenibacillus taiwanensis]|uniref:ATP-binding protein n=1 Tax=Paenibacillus taiwanensis TaxID=401638 RepID=UPI000402B4E3|nr:sensor histidine kinase [Paenibacillus taiwanensis]